MEIKLTAEEIAMGAFYGAQRKAPDMVLGKRPLLPNGCPDNEIWNNQAEGALGEMALAKHLGIEYDPGFAGAHDVGEFDVRTTHHENGHLLIQSYDKERLTVLVIGRFGTYRIMGCFYNPVAKQPKYWGNPLFEKRPCYAVPESDLIQFTNMTDLEKIKADEIQKHKHQCAVRQLLVYYFTDAKSYNTFIEKEGKDNPIFWDFVDQGKKGNKGDKNEWFE